MTERARVCGHGLKHDVLCGHTAWLAACTASSNAACAVFGDHMKPSTAERMVPSVSDGESAKWPRQRREVEGADQHATGKSGKSQKDAVFNT